MYEGVCHVCRSEALGILFYPSPSYYPQTGFLIEPPGSKAECILPIPTPSARLKDILSLAQLFM